MIVLVNCCNILITGSRTRRTTACILRESNHKSSLWERPSELTHLDEGQLLKFCRIRTEGGPKNFRVYWMGKSSALFNDWSNWKIIQCVQLENGYLACSMRKYLSKIRTSWITPRLVWQSFCKTDKSFSFRFPCESNHRASWIIAYNVGQLE